MGSPSWCLNRYRFCPHSHTQVLLRKPYTSAVDSWALGVITYILLSGTMPFDHEDKPVLYHSIIEGKYSFAGDVSSDVVLLARVPFNWS